MKKLLSSFLLFVVIAVNAFSLSAEKILQVKSAVSEIRYFGGKIFVATERGRVEILDLKTGETIQTINYPPFEDFTGELQLPKIFSVDISPDGKKIIAVVQASRGGRDIYIYEKKQLKKIISRKKHLPIAKVRFITSNRVLFGLSGDELVLYNLSEGKIIYRNPVGMSFFSDMEVNNDKTEVAVVDESGDTKIADIKTGKVIKVIEELNKDKVFDVDFKNDRVISGGRDKKAVFYDLKTDKYRIFYADDFMVFSVALSPSGKIGAYLYNDKFDVRIVDTETGELITVLKGHRATPSNLLFIDDNQLIIGCDDGKLYIWRLRK